MTFTPKEGMYCRTRAGAKVGPMQKIDEGMWQWAGREGGNARLTKYRAGGEWAAQPCKMHMYDLVAEWVDEPEASPVRTVTKQEIVPGFYAGFAVGAADEGRVHLVQGDKEMLNAAQLRAAARVFVSLAEALEQDQ